MDNLIIGKIVKVHGIKGAVKVIPILDNVNDFKKISGVFIENAGVFYEISKVFAISGAVGLEFVGIDTVEKAKSLVGSFVSVNRSVMDSLLGSDSFYIEDLKGSIIVFDETNEEVGVLTEIDNFGSADVFYIKSSKYKNLTLPHIEGLIVVFNMKEKKLIISKKKFEEIAVYGD